MGVSPTMIHMDVMGTMGFAVPMIAGAHKISTCFFLTLAIYICIYHMFTTFTKIYPYISHIYHMVSMNFQRNSSPWDPGIFPATKLHF